MKDYYFDSNLCDICGKTYPGCDAGKDDITFWIDVDNTCTKELSDQIIQCHAYQGR